MKQLLSGSIIALVAIIFALQNAEVITVSFLFWDIADISLALIIVLSLLIGILIGLLFMTTTIYQKSKLISELKTQIEMIKHSSDSDLNN